MPYEALFKYRRHDGSIGDYSTYINEPDPTERVRVDGLWERFIKSNRLNENKWRAAELTLTDKLMYPDSTYKGSAVASSDMLNDIMQYRQNLRDYSLRFPERPSRPNWFVG